MKNSSSSQEIWNINQFSGFTGIYDKYRPKMPSVIIDILTQLGHAPRPNLVVDLACGTGLSTRVWTKRAQNIIGVEPNEDMLSKARSMSKKFKNITYEEGTATETNIKDKTADIVTICQAIGWVNPTETFKEVSRILKPNGIFAAVDYFSPATTTLEISSVEKNFQELGRMLMVKYGFDKKEKRWDKDKYMELMESSGKFSYIQELGVYNKEVATAERIIGWNLSHSTTQILLKYGLSDDEVGISTLSKEINRLLKGKSLPMYVTYRLKVGQRKA
jgi:ubiquinone/menaquinone biosynthesis C-methylase UbiE